MTWILTTSEDHIDENFYYLTGLSKEKHVSATLLLNGNNKLILTNRLEHGLFKEKKIIIEKRAQFENILRKYCHGTVGMNLSYLSVNSHTRFQKILKGSKIVDISKELAKKREIKSAHEIRKIKTACKITSDTFDQIEKILKKARTEKELALELNYAAMKNGAEAIAFPTIIASGVNAALPHHSPTNEKISGLLLIDFGVVYDGYCSDMTRTFHIGKADEKAKRVYEIVYRAQTAGISKAKPNAKAKDVHNAAASIIKKELGQELIHSFGHGLGIEVHEDPLISSNAKTVLKNNMVITTEPGYYDKSWGGVRIEDDMVVGSPKPITKAPAFLMEINRQ